MRQVTYAELLEFLSEYPRPLKRHLYTIGEPPQLQWGDFTLGEWPNCVVATSSSESEAWYQIAEKP